MPITGSSSLGLLIATVSSLLFAYIYMVVCFSGLLFPTTFVFMATTTADIGAAWSQWHPPTTTWINNLTSVLSDNGVHGFIFNGSTLPDGVELGRYNWCNMPHVHPQTYVIPSTAFELVYVEVIQRHHKRTPYQDNSFPVETYSWDCSDQGLYTYGEPLKAEKNSSAQVYWRVEENSVNPFIAPGFRGNCQFPQITHGGLDDSWQHGRDLYEVYGTMLGFLPPEYDSTVAYRVTGNQITSQVAGMLVDGMFGPKHPKQVPLSIQPGLVDSLQPSYSCPKASRLYQEYGVGSMDPKWRLHLDKTKDFLGTLDHISGVTADDSGFHKSFDHYYDNLSARLCHQKPLPCSVKNSSQCVTQHQADTVFRMGQYEYSYIYRDSPQSLEAAVGSFGVWVAELADNIRNSVSRKSSVKYRHNIAHDGSISRLLSILQLNIMVWPGMGSEVVFEIYKDKKTGGFFVRALWSGKVLKSSHPGLGEINMLELETFLDYIEGLVGRRAEQVAAYCAG
ncbi:hypothetical protein TWF173_010803 [Orbilia oligospora]|uniref:Uncharacterized protein n=1 Tax=Orbilia oligospora TaxID=2813651 RepID=A0A7C8R263_ORBOL|nr:hypothetical protein TWF970_010685 [Orbilia oligospora]KAF3309527.1 hypothetical protein TWF173_010803 [Orbilia oligospora]